MQNIHTIVIGSGISGMAAASEIAQNGNFVLVLECNNYIGGRTKTIPVKLSNQVTFKFDEGASWIHGSCLEHPITQLSQKMGNVELIKTDDDSIVNYDKSGEEVNQQQFDKESEQYQMMLEKAAQFENISVYEAFQQMNGSQLSNKYFMYNVSNDIEFQTSAPIQDLSANGQQDQEFEGDQMLVTSGYQAFPQYLSAQQNIKVLTNHQVIQAAFNSSKNIVKCSNGQIFQAQNLIVSVPIGALKNGNIRFNPQLPSWKQEAIRKIHFGNVCKILIILKNKLIESQQHYIGVVQDNVLKRGCATYFLNLSGLAGLPALMTFGLGANADELQFMPQNQLKQLIASRLRVFGDESFSPNDFEIRRTSWRGNPNFRGTYSYSGVQTMPQHWENMAKPVFERKLYFCGEHTHSLYRGTVHGAYLSGLDAASCILDNIDDEHWYYQGVLGQQLQGQQEFNQENLQGNQQENQEEIQEGNKKQVKNENKAKGPKRAIGGKNAKSGKQKQAKQAKGGKKQEGVSQGPKEASPQCCQIA